MNSQQSPFKFLDAYEIEDEDKFFGREKEIDQLYEMVFETKLLLIYGASGVGKTSILRCGLANRFNSTQWLDLYIRKRDNINQSIYTSVRNRILDSDANANISEDLIDAIHLLYLYNFKPIYLIIDQFEEFFIFGDREEHLAFFDFVNRLIQSDLPCRLILSMREEYIAYLSEFEKEVPMLFDHRIRIEKMNRGALEEVISGTASAYDIEMPEPETTIDNIILNLSDKKGFNLTHLQVYFDRLYRLDIERRGNTERALRFDPDLLEQVGAIDDVLGEFLDEQLNKLEIELGKKDVPIDVLFFLVSDDATKQAIDIEVIKESLYRRKNITGEDVEFCIKRFSEMRIFKEIDE